VNLSSTTCLWIFLALLGASLVMQWVRAKKRQRLVRSADPARLAPESLERWSRIERGFDPFFKDFRKLQLVKQNLQTFPAEISESWRRYRRISRIEMATTAAMLLFAVSAFHFCMA
jgi:hypothetical protein